MKKLTLVLAFAAAAFGQTAETDKKTDRQKEVEERAHKHALALVRQANLAAPMVTTYGALLTQVSYDPVNWTLNTGDCSALKAKTRGTGSSKTTLTVQPNADGTFSFDMLTEVSGTAVDDLGNMFMFFYRNSSIVASNTALPEPKPPFNFFGPDTFQLVGIGKAPSYNIYQYFNGKVNPDGSFTDNGSLASGDPNCDPI